jgi:hypothetical protein
MKNENKGLKEIIKGEEFNKGFYETAVKVDITETVEKIKELAEEAEKIKDSFDYCLPEKMEELLRKVKDLNNQLPTEKNAILYSKSVNILAKLTQII